MKSIRSILEGRFEDLHLRSLKLLWRLPDERLFWASPADIPGLEPWSAGELLIRSAAVVEQTFGGITRRLWDDPFEWTLPEELGSRSAIAAYLEVVRGGRIEGFAFFRDDSDLFREIPAPEELSPIIEILIDTLTRAAHFEGRAHGIARQFLPIRLNILQ